MNSSKKANKFVIANPQICIGCATCMAGCYQSSIDRGKLVAARLIVTRTQSGTMPNQCRQCDNAPCANVCPVGALSFGKENIELSEELCIGCKMCVLTCPFGAIRLESVPNVSTELNPFFENEPRNIAVKCDLCAGSEKGPECVNVCPTGALMFIDKQTFEHKIFNQKAKNAVESFINTGLC